MIIIGGGVIGASIAYNLLNDGFSGRMLVFEKDRKYEYASTPRSAGGFRQLFSTKVNIEISKYSLDIYRNFPHVMAMDGELAEIDLMQRGYLFLATKETLPHMEMLACFQNKLGVPSRIVDERGLKDILPEINNEDLAGGLYCDEDGYLDPYSVMQGYIRKGKQLGAEYIYEEVETPLMEKQKMKGIRTVSGEEYQASIVINCAGAWASLMSEKIGHDLPVVPLKRQVFQFDCEKPLARRLPLTIDSTGVYFRHEGSTFICGYSENVKPGFDFKWKRSYFTEELWPILAHRVPNFERVKLQGGWSGLYEHNTRDQNAIIGEDPERKGYYLACGFSGHGMQQAPAVGKGLSELIRNGRYETIDLTPLRVNRFKENDLVVEEQIV